MDGFRGEAHEDCDVGFDPLGVPQARRLQLKGATVVNASVGEWWRWCDALWRKLTHKLLRKLWANSEAANAFSHLFLDDIFRFYGPIAETDEAEGGVLSGVEVLLVALSDDESGEMAMRQKDRMLLRFLTLLSSVEPSTDDHELELLIPHRVEIFELGVGWNCFSCGAFLEVDGKMFSLVNSSNSVLSISKVLDVEGTNSLRKVEFSGPGVVDEAHVWGKFSLHGEGSAEAFDELEERICWWR